MFITKKYLPRRTFLRGAAATIGLPLLDAMLPAATALANTGQRPTARYAFLHLPHGAIMGQWTPKKVGTDFEMTPILEPFEPFREIVANAGEGTGGHIQVTTDNFFQFPGSVVDASAGNPELSGTVEIHSPDVNLAGTLAPLPSTFLDAASLMRERCDSCHGVWAGALRTTHPWRQNCVQCHTPSAARDQHPTTMEGGPPFLPMPDDGPPGAAP